MDKKRFVWTFSIVALVVWSSSLWLYLIYMNLVQRPNWSEYILIKRFKTGCIVLASIYIIIQAILLKNSGSNYLLIIQKVILSCAGLLFIGILASQKPTAEGLDIVFLFFIAFVLRIIFICPLRLKFDIKTMFFAMAMWLFIILINETIIQGVILSKRFGQASDIVYNMAGILTGLLLSGRWFWFKC